MKIGILLIGFNRPENLTEVHRAAVAHGGGTPIVVHVDGSEPDSRYHSGNLRVRALVQQWQVRGEILNSKLQSVNLGCKYGPPAAISWGFEHFDGLIILEDDCVPDASFFPYCKELLIRYHHDLRVGSICGDNAYRLDLSRVPYSYCFISYPRIWGWATWKDRWQQYDPDWNKIKEVERAYGYIPQVAPSRREQARMSKALDLINNGIISNWDTQWWLAFAYNHWLCVQPTVNLIRNTGFGEGATHTHDSRSQFAKLLTEGLAFPLKHPVFVRPDRELDVSLSSEYTLGSRIKRYIRRFT
jgi:hypothetical protein